MTIKTCKCGSETGECSQTSKNAGKGGGNDDFREEMIELLMLSAKWGSILIDLTKRTYHKHIKPEIQYRIKDFLLYPDNIIGGKKKE